MTGTVFRVCLDRGFAFIRTPDEPTDVFMHETQLRGDLEFNEQLVERRVEFDVTRERQGLRARNVRAAD